MQNIVVDKAKVDIEHYVKIVRIRSYSTPHFPAFGLNTGKCGPE